MNARSLRFETLALGRSARIIPYSEADTGLAQRLWSRLVAERADLSIALGDATPSDHSVQFVVANDVRVLQQLEPISDTYYVCAGDNLHLQTWSAPPQNLDTNLWGCRLGLETVNTCNASCGMCPVENLTRRRQVMPMNIARSALAAASQHRELQTVNFYMNGEPLLDRRLEERISIARDMGLP